MTELPPELEGRLQSALCRVHDIEAQRIIRDLVEELQLHIYSLQQLSWIEYLEQLEDKVFQLEGE